MVSDELSKKKGEKLWDMGFSSQVGEEYWNQTGLDQSQKDQNSM